MGWNAGYTQYEQTVIEMYNTGKLDKQSLEIVLKPYRGTDMDHGGCHDLKSKDGLSADEIVVKLLDPTFFEEHKEKLNDLYRQCGVTTWEAWMTKDYPFESKERIEMTRLGSGFSDKWAELTETG